MGKRYTMPYEVAYYDGDITKKMTLPSMLAVVIRTSEEQSALLGRSAEYIGSLGLGWVITNYEITVNRLPQVGEKINITTEAMSYNKYFCYRNFWIHDEAGNECVLIHSTFVLMNKENRKMGSVSEEIIAPYESEKIKKIQRSEKIEKVENGQFRQYSVRYFDIDGNQHVNNAIYFNWLLDVLGYDFLSTHQPVHVNVKFDKEVEYGHVVESHYDIVKDETELKTRHEIRIGDQLYCEANIRWEEI